MKTLILLLIIFSLDTFATNSVCKELKNKHLPKLLKLKKSKKIQEEIGYLKELIKNEDCDRTMIQKYKCLVKNKRIWNAKKKFCEFDKKFLLLCYKERDYELRIRFKKSCSGKWKKAGNDFLADLLSNIDKQTQFGKVYAEFAMGCKRILHRINASDLKNKNYDFVSQCYLKGCYQEKPNSIYFHLLDGDESCSKNWQKISPAVFEYKLNKLKSACKNKLVEVIPNAIRKEFKVRDNLQKILFYSLDSEVKLNSLIERYECF